MIVVEYDVTINHFNSEFVQEKYYVLNKKN